MTVVAALTLAAFLAAPAPAAPVAAGSVGIRSRAVAGKLFARASAPAPKMTRGR